MGFRETISNVRKNVKGFLFRSPTTLGMANVSTPNNPAEDGQNKAFVSNDFLYKPPFGYPRMIDIPTIRSLAKTPYVFMVTSTIIDEVASVDWKIQPKPTFEMDEEGLEAQEADLISYQNKKIPRETLNHIMELNEFFNNPNKNDESFEFLIRAVTRDILEVDAGVLVKVFNKAGKFVQLFARDGGTFLKNPDIHGYMGNREEIIYLPEIEDKETKRIFFEKYLNLNAAYFQYGWVSMMPIPFGRREIIYLMRHPRSDSIYGRSAVELLSEVIKTLLYGARMGLEFYTNNNMPDGIIELLDAEKEQIDAFRERFEQQFKVKDEFGTWRKQFHKYPISNVKTDFKPFTLKPAEIELISQQQWFSKIVWASFGVTPSELGFTENSNRATEMVQSRVFRRKAIKPILNLLEYHINTQIIPEFGFKDVEFKFNDYDIEEDLQRHKLFEIQRKIGISTVNELREEIGKMPLEEEETEPMEEEENENQFDEIFDEVKKKEHKALNTSQPTTPKSFERVIKDYLKKNENEIIDLVDKLKSGTVKNIKANIIDDIIKKLGLVSFLEPEIRKFVEDSYDKGLQQAEKEFDRNFFPNKEAIDFLQDYNFDLIKNLTEEMKNKLKTTLQRGYIEDMPQAQLKKEVKKIFEDMENRAKSIVRTEQARAENYGELDGASQSKVVKGKTISNYMDAKTSPLCRRMISKYGDKLIPLDQNFKDDKTGGSWKAPPFHVNCFLAGTKIKTDNGLKNIENIIPGDKVKTHKQRYKTVYATMSRQVDEEIYEIETSKGKIEVTGNHPIMTSNGWKPAKDINLNDWVMYIK
jgi:hypothetical protein